MVDQIYDRAGLTPEEQEYMPIFINGDDHDFYESTQFEKLYEYLAFTISLMPYENAKGKTATPDDWILDFLIKFEEI